MSKAGGRERPRSWVPQWVGSLGMPVWITDPDLNISYLNERAEALLGRSATECVGLPCYRVIAGTNASGLPCCGPHCPVAGLARVNREIEPVEMRIPGPDNKGRWIQVLTITARAPDQTGPWLVHCALPTDRAHRLKDYLARVASRTGRPELEVQAPKGFGLTRREEEILGHLAEDESLHEIADKLHVSYITVRNHVQHILAKLGVHSIEEAVACHLLATD